jgi:hypothetical protein
MVCVIQGQTIKRWNLLARRRKVCVLGFDLKRLIRRKKQSTCEVLGESISSLHESHSCSYPGNAGSPSHLPRMARCIEDLNFEFALPATVRIMVSESRRKSAGARKIGAGVGQWQNVSFPNNKNIIFYFSML